MNRPTFVCFVFQYFMLTAIETYVLFQEPCTFIFDSAATAITNPVNFSIGRNYARKLSTLNCINDWGERLLIVLLWEIKFYILLKNLVLHLFTYISRRTVKSVKHKSNRLLSMWSTTTSWNTEHCRSSLYWLSYTTISNCHFRFGINITCHVYMTI